MEYITGKIEFDVRWMFRIVIDINRSIKSITKVQKEQKDSTLNVPDCKGDKSSKNTKASTLHVIRNIYLKRYDRGRGN